MKKTIILLILSAYLLHTAGAQNSETYKTRASNNKAYLIKDQNSNLWSQVGISSDGLKFTLVPSGHDNHSRETIMVNWRDVPKLVSRLENFGGNDVKEATWGTVQNYWAQNIVNQSAKWAPTVAYKEYPSSIEGLRVCIDPAGFSNTLAEATRYEKKFVKIKAAVAGTKKDIAFYSAELNDLTAVILEKKLLAAGAKPFRTKPLGISAVGKTFKEWYSTDLRKELGDAYNRGFITHDEFNDYIEHKTDTFLIYNAFRRIEFRQRIWHANIENPDVTISIQYNAADGNKRLPGGYLNPVEQNYSMAFIPGAFLGFSELERLTDKLEFLRLLLSPDIDKSARLAYLILKNQYDSLGIPPVSNENTIIEDRYCVPTTYQGVYARNLAMTRTVKGPVVYFQPLLQDNLAEAKLLSKKDYVFKYSDDLSIKAPKRCEEVAEAIFQGIVQWVDENKLMAKK